MNDKENVEIEYYRDGVSIRFIEFLNENGERHRTYGPAFTEFWPSGGIATELWDQHGKYHRTRGPAMIFYDESGCIDSEHWLLDGKQIHPEQWLEENNYSWPLTEKQQAHLVKHFSEIHELDLLVHPLYQDLRNYF